jgi:hypothetical protein
VECGAEKDSGSYARDKAAMRMRDPRIGRKREEKADLGHGSRLPEREGSLSKAMGSTAISLSISGMVEDRGFEPLTS